MREREQDDLVVDICPQCRGVWLDAGELEKLTTRERRYYDDDEDDDDRRNRDRDRERRSEAPRDDRYRPNDSGRGSASGYRSQPKKKGFLSTIFESIGEGGGD